VIGSIVGIQKYVYDIFGPAVNLAARLEQLRSRQILVGAETRLRADPRRVRAAPARTPSSASRSRDSARSSSTPSRTSARKGRIHAPPQNGLDAQALLCGEIATTWFPVPLSEIGARLDVRNAAPEFWLDGGVRVASLRVTHGGHTVGYRIDADGASVVYVPDNELAADAGERSFDELRRFAQGADLLIHGAMFTVPEYATRTGWGHSTFERALELATRADARRLCIFHHAPDRTDEELDGIVDGMNEAARGRTIVMAAAEGIGMELEGSARV
jgi:hypothetical protein